MKTLIFEPNLNGHHLEYLHHIYSRASVEHENQFIFAVPESFHNLRDKFDWNKAENIYFIYLSENKLQNKLKTNIELLKIILKHQPENTFLISLIWYMPFIVFLLFLGTKISGIIYNIYLYEWKYSNWKTKVKNTILYTLLSKCPNISNLFILNDSSSVCVLNKIWKTRRFKYLPDPFVSINTNKSHFLRRELGIGNNKTIFLHFGAMSARKGTLQIFNMIENTNVHTLENICVIFAGKVGKDIKEQFYNKYNLLKDKVKIIIDDEFIDYERIGSYLLTCDYVLLPYTYTSLSSGVIGYCAQFNKPAIGPNRGLLGKLIRKNRLGLVLDRFESFDNLHCQYKENEYCKKRSVDVFTNIIFNNLT